MSNDVKWMEYEMDLSFVPQVGTDIAGISAEQPLRISGLLYDVPGEYVKLRLAWLSPEPMDSKDMLNHGWKFAVAKTKS